MLLDAPLRRPVVVGANDERRIGTGPGGELRQANGLRRGVGPGARHHEHPAGRRLDAFGDHPLVLIVRERGRLAGGAHRADAGRARGSLEVDLLRQSHRIEDAVAKGSDQGD